MKVLAISAFAVVLMGARLPIKEGCTSSRGFRWVDATGADELLSFKAIDTSTFNRDMVGLNRLTTGSQWVGDDHSRLVLFTQGIDFEFPRQGPLEFPDYTLVNGWLAQQRGLSVNWSDYPNSRILLGRAREIPWGGGAPMTVQNIAMDGTCSETFVSRHMNPRYCAQTVRNVDIGLCSVRLPWVADPANSNIVLNLLNIGSRAGTGIAELIASGIQEGILEHDGTVVRSVEANIDLIPVAQAWTRYVPNHDFDELCVRTNYMMRPKSNLIQAIAATFLLLPFVGDCEARPTQVEFCGRFGAEDGQITFDVSNVQASMEGYGSARIVCNGAADAIEDKIVSGLEELAGPLLSATLGEKLRISETTASLISGEVRSECDQLNLPVSQRTLSDAAIRASCADAYPGLGAACGRRNPEDTTESIDCWFDVGVDRAGVLPTGLEVVLAENDYDAIFGVLNANADVADLVCGTTEEGDGGTRSLEVGEKIVPFRAQGMIVDWPDAGLARPY